MATLWFCGHDARQFGVTWWDILQVYQTPADLHSASINSISWAPYKLGLILACASSDGTVSVLKSLPDGTWEAKKVSVNKADGGE